MDFIGRVSTQIILPEVFRQAARRNIDVKALSSEDYQDDVPDEIRDMHKGRMFKDMSIIKVISLAMRWHERNQDLQRRTDIFEDPVTWPALFAPMIIGNHVRAHCLTDHIQLQNEGDHMDHCVGSYAFQCAFAQSHIVSLEAHDGSWKTTMELVEQRKNEAIIFEVAQHVGPQNSTNLHPDALAAEAALLEYLETAPIDFEAIYGSRDMYRDDPSMKERIQIGFDWMDKTACDDAYDAWRGSFPDMFPDMTRLGYLKRTGISAAIVRRITAPYKPVY